MMTLSDIHERIADTIDEWHETAKRATKALESIAESLSKLQTLSEDLVEYYKGRNGDIKGVIRVSDIDRPDPS